MKRFLLAPIVALTVLFVVAAPTSAQTADPVAELAQLRRDHHYMHRDYDALFRQLKRCQMPEESDIQHVLTSANDVSRRAAALAPRLGGRQHVQALTIQDVAEFDFLVTSNITALPDVCYVPPAE